MKKTNTHLDDLFASARQQDPVVSKEDARDLLSESNRMQPVFSIISTTGAIMTTFGLSIAALTAYFILGASPSTNQESSFVRQEQNPQSVVLPQHTHTTTSPVLSTPSLHTRTVEVSDKDLFLPKLSTPIKVDGIKPITLSADKFAKLGITKKDDGTVTFAENDGHGKMLSMNFQQNTWGITVGEDEHSGEPTSTATFSPVMVTDTKGNRRMMLFNKSNDGMSTQMIRMESRANGSKGEMQIQTSVDGGSVQINDGSNQVGNSNGANQMSVSGTLNPVGRNSDDDDAGMSMHAEVKSTTAITNDKNGMQHPKSIKIFINSNERTCDTTVNGKQKKIVLFNKTIERDSTLASLQMRNSDSIFAQVRKQLRGVQAELGVSLDSAIDALTSSIKDAEITLKGNGSKLFKRMNLDSVLQLATDNLKEAEQAMEERCNALNTLVPVLARSATKDHYDAAEGITYDDGLIFWYEPSKEVTDVIAKAPSDIQRSVSPLTNAGASIISNAVLYPNPARNTTVLKFSAAEPRTVALSIHDLLGKRVLDAGTIRLTEAGDTQHELDVHELTPGVYLLVITTDKGEQSMQRLVIER